MDKENLKLVLEKIDFQLISVNKFCIKYNFNPKTIRKYLNEFNIKYNKKSFYYSNRNKKGQFIGKIENVSKNNDDIKIETNKKFNEINKKFSEIDRTIELAKKLGIK